MLTVNSDYPLVFPSLQVISGIWFRLIKKLVLETVIRADLIMFGEFHADLPRISFAVAIRISRNKLITVYTIRSLSYHVGFTLQFEWVMDIHNPFYSLRLDQVACRIH